MRGGQWCFHLDSLALTLSQGVREFSCPPLKFVLNSVVLLLQGEEIPVPTVTIPAEQFR